MKSQKGITLIALVITIIVMLILVAVTVTIAVNEGLFEKAGEAGRQTNTKVKEEQNLADGYVLYQGELVQIDEIANRIKDKASQND